MYIHIMSECESRISIVRLIVGYALTHYTQHDLDCHLSGRAVAVWRVWPINDDSVYCTEHAVQRRHSYLSARCPRIRTIDVRGSFVLKRSNPMCDEAMISSELQPTAPHTATRIVLALLLIDLTRLCLLTDRVQVCLVDPPRLRGRVGDALRVEWGSQRQDARLPHSI